MGQDASYELERLRVLAKLDVLSAEREAIFDGLTKLAADLFCVPFAAISFVASDQQGFKSTIGFEANATPRAVSFCHYAIQTDDVTVVLDATQDRRFRNNPLVTEAPHIRFFAGAPLVTHEGYRLGALCLMDQAPHTSFDAKDRKTLASLAASVVQALVLRSEAIESQKQAQLAADRGRLLSLSEQMAGLGTWSWDLARNQTDWSTEVYRIHGVDPGLPALDLDRVLALYVPEDRERLRVVVERAMADGLDYEHQGTVIWPNMERRDVLARGTVRKGADGKVEALMGTYQDVTHLRLADAALRAGEARFRRLTDNANDIFTEASLDGRFTFVSPASTRITGFAPSEAIGRQATDFVHPDDRERVKAEISSALNHAGSEIVEYRHIRKDGRVIWLEARPMLARDPVTGKAIAITDIIRDVTERVLAERAVADREARFRLLSENATDIVAQYTIGGEFIYLSPSIHDAMGYRPEELIGRKVQDFIAREDLHRVLSQLQKYVEAGPDATPIYFEYRAPAKDGSLVWLEAHPMKLYDPESGGLIGFQDVVRNVTNRKTIEADLQQARDAAIVATKAKSAFLANMTHEIRTPLTAILGFTRLLSEGSQLSPQHQKYVTRIAAASEALVALVSDVLDFSKIEAGELKINLQAANAAELIEGAVAIFEAQAREKGIDLNLVVDPQTPHALSVDRDKVRQVVLNLVSNAIKFTDVGAVTIEARYNSSEEELQIEISDTGTGLTCEQSQSLFQRFSQADMSTTRRHGGTGLGLAISKGLVEAMGGEIGVRSAVGTGSSFWFHIPARPAAARQSPSPSALSISLAGLRVLIVDDNASVREITRAILESVGAEVSEQEDPVQSVALLGEQSFDVMLFDQQMPGLSGEALLAQVRATPGPNQFVPTLLFSANDHDQQRVQRAGFFAHLAKPVTPLNLVTSVIRAFNEAAPAHA